MTSMLGKMADLQKLGERLLLARRRKGLSQGDLSKLAPCDLSLISRIERGVKPSLSVEVLCRLARALDTSPNDLLGWEQAHNRPHTLEGRQADADAPVSVRAVALLEAATDVAKAEIRAGVPGEAGDVPPPKRQRTRTAAPVA